MRQLLRAAVALVMAAACSQSRASTSDGDVAQSDGELERALASNATLRDAVKAIDGGHPWKATLAVAPIVSRDPGNRAAVLVAARAAASWDGWTEVDRLLARKPWLDSAFNGEAHELLARAALAANAPDSAIRHAGSAVVLAVESDRPMRRVYLARALDRGVDPDSAATVYLAAAKSLPLVADWLRLRAAGAEKDAEARGKLYAEIRSEIAKSRVPWTEAQARERFGDLAGAAERFAALGAKVSALRLRLALAPDSEGASRLRDSLVAMLRGQPSRDDARQIVQILDKTPAALPPRDELEIGRALASIGPLPRALAAFDRANRAGLLRPQDRMTYALALARGNRIRDAIAQFDAIAPPSPLAGQAAYQRARLGVTSNPAATMTALRAVADSFSSDVETAPMALYLYADLATDAGADDVAIAAYRELYSKYSSNARADDARFRAAILDLAHGRARAAAIQFDSLVAIHPNSSERSAAQYWSGQAWKAANDARRATVSWTAVMTQAPSSYYGQAAAQRLKKTEWSPRSQPEKFTAFPAIDSAMKRVRLLERLGMDAEVRFELDALDDRATASSDVALSIANAFRDHGDVARAIRIANRLIDQGASDARVYRLAFPLVDREELVRQSHAQRLDPALVAGLIKQESSFEPHATSVANARGLMQVLPTVGSEIARALKFPVWSPALLYDADANLELGTAHLAAATKQYGDLTRILAAYNAGSARVDRWQKKTGASDPELFTEEIPFAETRDYVRVVQRNREMYRMLYGLK